MFVVDTNVLVYAADASFAEHERARRLIETWRRQATPWYTTWGIAYEFLRVVTHPRVLRRPWTAPEAWTFVDALAAAPALRILTHTEHHREVARQVLGDVPDVRGNLLHDAHTAILMREHGIRTIYTRDTDFHRFAFLDVVDPLTA